MKQNDILQIFIEKHRHRLGKIEFPNDKVLDFAALSYLERIEESV